MKMKRYITRDNFLNDYGYQSIRDEKTTDEQITYAIQIASSRVNTLAGGAINKSIRTGFYNLSDDGVLSIAPGKITDPEKLAEAEDALNSIQEQTAAIARFALDTGWDFISGSFSASLGGQNTSETIDFETSKNDMEKTAREALQLYDFNTLFWADGIDVAFDDEDENVNDDKYDPKKKPLSEEALVSRITGGFIKGANGVKIVHTMPGVPSKGITITIEGKDFILPNYTDPDDMLAKGNDGSLGTYEKDGHPVIILKYAGTVIEFPSLAGAGGADHPALDADIKTLWNAISKAEADIDIVWKDDTHLNYEITGAKQDLPYQVVDITTAGAVISSTSPVDVWSRIKNKNNQYEVILTKTGETLKYTFNGGYEITITATADGGNAKFLYSAVANKIFIQGTNATLTDNKGQTDVALIQLDISATTIGATSAKANYEFTLTSAPSAGDVISKLQMQTSDEKLLAIIMGVLKMLDTSNYATTEKLENFQDDIFVFERNQSRNEAIHNPIFNPTDGVSTPFTLKKGINNDYAANEHTLQIVLYDVDNKLIYSTQYDPANVINYNAQIILRIPVNGVQKDFFVSVWDKEYEAADDTPVNRVDIEQDAAGSGIKPPFRYEVYVIDRQPGIADTHPVAKDAVRKPTGRVVSFGGGHILQLPATAFADVQIGGEAKINFEAFVAGIAGGADAVPDDATLFIGDNGAVKQTVLGSGVKSALMWGVKTNASDVNIKDHWETSILTIKKRSETEYDFISWETDPKYKYMLRAFGNAKAPKGVPIGAIPTVGKDGDIVWLKLSHEYSVSDKAHLPTDANVLEGDVALVISEDKFYHYHIKTDPADTHDTGWKLHVDSGGEHGTPGATANVIFDTDVQRFLEGKDGTPPPPGPNPPMTVVLGSGYTGVVKVAPKAQGLELGSSGRTELIGSNIQIRATDTMGIQLPDGKGGNAFIITSGTKNGVPDYTLAMVSPTYKEIYLSEVVEMVLWWRTHHGGGIKK